MRLASIVFACLLVPCLAVAGPIIPNLSKNGVRVEKLTIEYINEYTIQHLRLTNPSDDKILWNWECVAIRGDVVFDSIALFFHAPPGQSYRRLALLTSAWNSAERLECY